MPAWLVFLLSAVTVILAGIRLAREGEVIAQETGLGGLWVGAILLAAATSLPELLTDSYAVLQGSPNLAIGDLFGSSMANMAILAGADLMSRQARMMTRVAINQALVASLAICLTMIGIIGATAGLDLAILGMGVPTLVIGFVYVAGMRVIHLNRPTPAFRAPSEVPKETKSKQALQRSLVTFGLASLLVLIAARYVASSAAVLADQFGVSQGFVGLALLAFTTSLPELVVSITCVRRGLYDLAVGNLFGSNCFNMAVVVPLDLLEGGGSLLAQTEPGLVLAATFAVLMMGLAVFEILNKSERRIWLLEPGPTVMLLVYVLGLYLTYAAGS